jgi:hypothetical protein
MDIMGPASSTEDDMLEKMLKEAEVLAARMSSIELGKSPSVTQPLVDSPSLPSNSSDHSKLTVRQQSVNTESSDKLDPLLQNAESMVQQVKEQNSSPVVEPKASLAQQLAESKESLGKLSDLDEVLRQSEALLQKMRSKNSVASGEINDTTTTPEEAPSSVYLLRSNSSGLDDVSSVGSASLRATSNLSDALNASKVMADSVKEIVEEREMDNDHHAPSTPIPSAPNEDQTPVKDYTPHSVTSRSSVSSNHAEQPILQTVIPDFTITAADTQWEKVESANKGDKDFVPIRDYSSEPRKKVTTTPLIVPTKQSRLATFRGEAKRRKRRQQRILKAVAVGAVFTVLVVWSRSGGDSSTSQIIQTPSESVSDSMTTTQEDVPIILVEAVSETVEEPETIEEPPMDEEPILEPVDVEESQLHDDVEVDAQEEVDLATVEQEQEEIVEESPVSVQELDVEPEPTIQVATKDVAAFEESNSQQEPIDEEKRFCKNLLDRIVSTPCRLFLRASKQSRKPAKKDLLMAALL